MKKKAAVRAKTTIRYHGRRGQPVLHWTDSGRPYIMVRAEEGRGVRRLYLDTKHAAREIQNHANLLREARRRRR